MLQWLLREFCAALNAVSYLIRVLLSRVVPASNWDIKLLLSDLIKATVFRSTRVSSIFLVQHVLQANNSLRFSVCWFFQLIYLGAVELLNKSSAYAFLNRFSQSKFVMLVTTFELAQFHLIIPPQNFSNVFLFRENFVSVFSFWFFQRGKLPRSLTEIFCSSSSNEDATCFSLKTRRVDFYFPRNSKSNIVKLICILFFSCSRFPNRLYNNNSSSASFLYPLNKRENFHMKNNNIIFLLFSSEVLIFFGWTKEGWRQLQTQAKRFYTSEEILLIFMGFWKCRKKELLIVARREWKVFYFLTTFSQNQHRNRGRFNRDDKGIFVTATEIISTENY